jgi:hypothetical protein
MPMADAQPGDLVVVFQSGAMVRPRVPRDSSAIHMSRKLLFEMQIFISTQPRTAHA